MESNSATGKIHCSQSTADLIAAGGKQKWLTEREDKIIAKGKGEMTTFWIDLASSDGETQVSGESTERSLEDASEAIQNLDSCVLRMSEFDDEEAVLVKGSADC